MSNFKHISADLFVLYFFLPAITVCVFLVSRIYYGKTKTPKIRFNIGEDLIYGNLVAPIVGLAMVLGIFSYILNIYYFHQIRWELLTLFSICFLTLIIGIGVGGHLTAISIERTIPKVLNVGKTKELMYFFHMPFGHKLTYVPTFLVFYLLILLDIFKGTSYRILGYQLLILSIFSIAVGVLTSLVMIASNISRLMFYTTAVISISILFVIGLESATLANHMVALFFSITFFTMSIILAIYRYVPPLSSYFQIYIDKKYDIDREID